MELCWESEQGTDQIESVHLAARTQPRLFWTVQVVKEEQ